MSKVAAVPVTRIVPYADGRDITASRDFVEVLGLEVGMEDPVLGLSSPANPKAQVIIPPAGMEEPVFWSRCRRSLRRSRCP